MARTPNAPSKRTAKKTVKRQPMLEWIFAGLGLLITLTVLGVLMIDAFKPTTPPELSARLVAVRPVAAGFQADVEITNAGRSTAASVDVEGVLTPGLGREETATATLAYVPGGGTEPLTLMFRTDPRQGKLELNVRGWSEP